VLAGFENHGGRTHLGAAARPLGRVLTGHGNNGADGYEGVRGGPRGTVLGTYLHGPLLPKNAWFADWLAATALGAPAAELARLDDALEDAAHQGARRAAGV
jgi:CobQ-like glutamine amidotransferase family enzyme